MSSNQQIAAEKPSISFLGFSQINRARCESPSGFNHQLHSWTTSDWFTALMGELGEAANVAKKLNRVRDGIPGNKEKADALRAKLRQELGDTFVYLDLLAQSLGFNIGDAALEVFNAKSAELGYKEPNLLRALEEKDAQQPPTLERMVDRFLTWRLPKDFMPDSGISFTPSTHALEQEAFWPVGTNLLTAIQAKAMIEYLLAPEPPAQPSSGKCGKPTSYHLIAGGSYYACVLEKGHEGDCQPGGTCFAHGDYVGTPHCPKPFEECVKGAIQKQQPSSGTEGERDRLCKIERDALHRYSDPGASPQEKSEALLEALKARGAIKELKYAARPAESRGEQPQIQPNHDASGRHNPVDCAHNGCGYCDERVISKRAALRQPSEREQELEQQVKAVRESWKREQATYKEIQDENESLAAELQATREALRGLYDAAHGVDLKMGVGDGLCNTCERVILSRFGGNVRPHKDDCPIPSLIDALQQARALLNPTPPESKTEYLDFMERDGNAR